MSFCLVSNPPLSINCLAAMGSSTKVGALKFRSLIRRLPLHVWAQSVPGYAVREARKIFDFLDADQMTAGNISFQHQSGKAMARGEQAGGQATKP